MKKMKIKTFIFVHEQKIILDYISVNKFKFLEDVTYIFLGENPTNMIEKLPNVIVCRNLPYNMEEYPKLTSYTGWYAIWKNNLHEDCDIINLFEYDINLTDDFIEKFNNVKKYDVIGYIKIDVRHPNYIKKDCWSKFTKESIMKNYKINILDFVLSLPNGKVCGITSNHSFNIKVFEEYMNWVNPLIDDIKLSPLSGHEVERSISLFYLLHNKNYTILENVLFHYQFDSHKTQGISQNKFIENYHNLLK